MKSLLKYAFVSVLALMPSFAMADFDIASYLQQVTRMTQKDGVGLPMQMSIGDLQNVSMNMNNPSFSNINPSNVKSLGATALQKANERWKLDDKMPAGFANAINGNGSNPLLRGVVKKEMTVGKRSGDDVKKNKERDEKINKLMIENTSSLYARGLTRRYQLDNEKVDEVEDFNNVNAVQAVLSNTVQRADNRWMSILKAESSTMLQTATQQMTSIKPDETEEAEKDEKKEATSQDQTNVDNGNSDKNKDDSKDKDKKSKLQQASDWVKDKNDKANAWVKDQKDKAGDWISKNNGGVADWLNKGNNQQGVQKIIGGALGDSTVGSVLSGATDELAKHGSKDKNNDSSKSKESKDNADKES